MDDMDDIQAEDYYTEADDIRAEFEAEMYNTQWDNDPNPYHGTYSEE